MKHISMPQLSLAVISGAFLLFASSVVFTQQKAYGAACEPGTNLGALTQDNISVEKAGKHKVWVRLSADQIYAKALGVEVSPGGTKAQCFEIANTSTASFGWVSTPAVSLPLSGTKIRLVGLREKVKIDRVVVLEDTDPCRPDNLRNITYSPVIEPGDNCLFPPSDDPVIPDGPVTIPLASYDFGSSIDNWGGQGNTLTTINRTEGNINSGSLQVTVDRSGLYPDDFRTARVGTSQGVQGIKLGAGKKVSARMFVKAGSTPRDARCEIRFFNNDTILNTAEGQLSQASSDWSERTCSATSPANTTSVSVRLFISDTSYGEVFYLDDVELVQGELSDSPSTPTTPTTPVDPEPEPIDTTRPTVPGNLRSEIRFDWGSFSYVRKLSWGASTDNKSISNYIVRRDSQKIGDSITNNYIDSNELQTGKKYTYEVLAIDTAGNSSQPARISSEGSCFLVWCWGN